MARPQVIIYGEVYDLNSRAPSPGAQAGGSARISRQP